MARLRLATAAATVVVAVSVAGCGTDTASVTRAADAPLGAGTTAAPAQPSPTPGQVRAVVPPTPATSTAPAARHVAARKLFSFPSPAVIAAVAARLPVYAAPNGHVLRYLPKRTPLGSPQTLLVTGQRGGWLQVELPFRPNGSHGWIQASSVTTTTTPMQIVVDRHARTLTLMRGEVTVRRFPVSVGTSGTPTPTGVFFVMDSIDTLDPSGPYGPWAFGLSGYSNVLTSFDGGDGVVGIHGTNADWTVGHPESHGCVRMHNRDIAWLSRKVPLGTPVIVN